MMKLETKKDFNKKEDTKIVFFHFSNNYINSSLEDFYRIMENKAEVAVIDLCFAEEKTISRILKKAKFVVIDTYLINLEQLRAENLQRKFLDRIFDYDQCIKIREQILESTSFKILIALHYDLHWELCSGSLTKSTLFGCINAIAWPYENWSPENWAEKQKDEWFPEKDELVCRRQEIMQNFTNRLDFPHNVTLPPGFRKFEKKKYDVVVPGIRYKTRTLAEESLNKSELKQAPYKILDNLYRYCDYASVRTFNIKKFNGFLDFLRKKNYYGYIEKSKTAWVDGSALSYPVKKFFEVPSLGTLMFTNGFPGMVNYGLVENENYIKCQPEEYAFKVEDFLKQINTETMRIINNSLEKIQKLHTTEMRALQFLSYLEKMEEEDIQIGKFENGKLSFY